MKIPSVKTILDKEWDKEVLVHFLDERDNQYDFGYERIATLHPNIVSVRGKNVKEKSDIITPYVDKYYQNNLQDIEDARKRMQFLWGDISLKYFTELQKIFGSLDFYKPKEIRAALSIAKAGVIGDDNTSFQIWYQTINEPNEVRRHFAHEILHFYYYAYLKQKGLDSLAQNWDLAEIFVVVVLGLPQFTALIGKKDEGYQRHEKYFLYYRDLWNKCSNVDEYLEKTNIEGLVII